MWILIILSILSWILLVVINPINIITWVSFVTTATFILRPFGFYVKVNKIIPVEALFAFLAFNVSLLFKTFDIVTYIMMIAARCIFYCIVLYDDKQYVYIQEEVEKEI